MITNIEVKAVMSVNHTKVMDLFWDIAQWTAIWNPIEKITVKYDDGFNQEFCMSVWRNNNQENIRTIRSKELASINFFSPTPPPMMSRHSGAWLFYPVNGKKCIVIAKREYELIKIDTETESFYKKRSFDFYQQFSQRLNKILEKFCFYFQGLKL